MRMANKVVLITGGGTGIGAASARIMAREGAAVAVMGRRQDPLNAVVSTILDAGGKAIAIPGDVIKSDDCRRAVDQTVENLGQLHVLVNSAGTSAVGTAMETDQDEWHEVLNTNATSTYLMCKFALPHMIETGSGSIINISSVSGIRGNRQRVAYNTAKGAVCSLTQNLAVDFSSKGVRSNAILPGLVETDMPKYFRTLDGQTWDQIVASDLPRYPIGRIGQPEDVANCVLYLASDESAWVTGQLIAVDGGLTCGLI